MIILDNFIKDDRAFRSISKSPFWKDKSYYWHLMSELDNGIGSYIVSQLLQVDNLPFSMIEAQGFEYWPTVLSSYGEPAVVGSDGEKYSLDIHVDKDENLAEETGDIVLPLFGAVLYFIDMELGGGDLKYWKDEHTYKLIQPRNNSLVVFDVSQPHAVTEITKGFRRSISINFWKNKPQIY